MFPRSPTLWLAFSVRYGSGRAGRRVESPYRASGPGSSGGSRSPPPPYLLSVEGFPPPPRVLGHGWQGAITLRVLGTILLFTFAAGGHAGRGHSLMLWGAASPCPSLHLLIVPPFSFKHVPGGLIYSYSFSYGARKKIGGSAQVPGGLGARNFNYHLCAPLGRGGAEGIDTNRQAQMPSDTGNKAKQNGDRTELHCYFGEVAARLHLMSRPECS